MQLYPHPSLSMISSSNNSIVNLSDNYMGPTPNHQNKVNHHQQLMIQRQAERRYPGLS